MTRILVVDDNRPQMDELGVMLREAGCKVTFTGNLREAMDYFVASPEIFSRSAGSPSGCEIGARNDSREA